jgi:hypothetical protein
MNLRFTILAGASALALSTLVAVPAHAAEYPVGTMADNMLTAGDAATLGVAGNHVKEFLNLSGSKESPMTIWLCDLEGSTEIEVAGPRDVYAMTYMSSKNKVETLAQQELFAFDTENEARKAMKAIRKSAEKCKGTFTVKHDDGWVSTQKVSHGKGTDGAGHGFIWIKHVTTETDPSTRIAEHEYSTFHRVGNFIQTMEIDVEGINPPDLSKSQIKGVNKLTGSLGDIWE